MGIVQATLHEEDATVTAKETVRHNIGMTFDFLKHLTRDPSMLKEIRNGSTIEFVQKDTLIKERSNSNKRLEYVKVSRRFETI